MISSHDGIDGLVQSRCTDLVCRTWVDPRSIAERRLTTLAWVSEREMRGLARKLYSPLVVGLRAPNPTAHHVTLLSTYPLCATT